LTAVYKLREDTEKYIATPPKKEEKSLLHWHSIITFVEAKNGKFSPGDLNQAASYATVLPLARPDVAGVLYFVVCKTGFVVAWSDASRIVCTNFKNGTILNATKFSSDM
jgi:hypothetical protein